MECHKERALTPPFLTVPIDKWRNAGRGAHLLLQVRCAVLNGDLLTCRISSLVSNRRGASNHAAVGLSTPPLDTVPIDKPAIGVQRPGDSAHILPQKRDKPES